MNPSRPTVLAQRYLEAIQNGAEKGSDASIEIKAVAKGETLLERENASGAFIRSYVECNALLPIPNSAHLEQEAMQSRNGSTSPSRIRPSRSGQHNTRDSVSNLNYVDKEQSHKSRISSEKATIADSVSDNQMENQWQKYTLNKTSRETETSMNATASYKRRMVNTASPVLTDTSDPTTDIISNRSCMHARKTAGTTVSKRASHDVMVDKGPPSLEKNIRMLPSPRRKIRLSDDQGWIKRRLDQGEMKKGSHIVVGSTAETINFVSVTSVIGDDQVENDTIEESSSSPQHEYLISGKESSSSASSTKVWGAFRLRPTGIRTTKIADSESNLQYKKTKIINNSKTGQKLEEPQSLHRDQAIAGQGDVEIDSAEVAISTKSSEGQSIAKKNNTGSQVLKDNSAQSEFLSVKCRLKNWNRRERKSHPSHASSPVQSPTQSNITRPNLCLQKRQDTSVENNCEKKSSYDVPMKSCPAPKKCPSVRTESSQTTDTTMREVSKKDEKIEGDASSKNASVEKTRNLAAGTLIKDRLAVFEESNAKGLKENASASSTKSYLKTHASVMKSKELDTNPLQGREEESERHYSKQSQFVVSTKVPTSNFKSQKISWTGKTGVTVGKNLPGDVFRASKSKIGISPVRKMHCNNIVQSTSMCNDLDRHTLHEGQTRDVDDENLHTSRGVRGIRSKFECVERSKSQKNRFSSFSGASEKIKLKPRTANFSLHKKVENEDDGKGQQNTTKQMESIQGCPNEENMLRSVKIPQALNNSDGVIVHTAESSIAGSLVLEMHGQKNMKPDCKSISESAHSDVISNAECTTRIKMKSFCANSRHNLDGRQSSTKMGKTSENRDKAVANTKVAPRPRASGGIQKLRSKFEALSKDQQLSVKIEEASIRCIEDSKRNPGDMHRNEDLNVVDIKRRENNSKMIPSQESIASSTNKLPMGSSKNSAFEHLRSRFDTSKSPRGSHSSPRLLRREKMPGNFETTMNNVAEPSSRRESNSDQGKNNQISLKSQQVAVAASVSHHKSVGSGNAAQIVQKTVKAPSEDTNQPSSPPNDIPWRNTEPNDIPWVDRELIEEREHSFITQKADIDMSYGAEYLDYSYEDDDCDGVTLSPTASDVSSLSIPSCLQSVEPSSVASDSSQTSDEDTGAMESVSEKQSTTLGPSEASSSQTSEAATPLIHSTLGAMSLRFGIASSSDTTGTTSFNGIHFNGLLATLPPPIDGEEGDENSDELPHSQPCKTGFGPNKQFEEHLNIKNGPKWKNDFFAVDSVKSHPTTESGEASQWVSFQKMSLGKNVYFKNNVKTKDDDSQVKKDCIVKKPRPSCHVLSAGPKQPAVSNYPTQMRASNGLANSRRRILSSPPSSNFRNVKCMKHDIENKAPKDQPVEASLQRSGSYRRFDRQKLRAFQNARSRSFLD